MNDQIKQAIERSISHNEIVSVTIAGNVDDAIVAIESLIDYDTTETDHVLIDGNSLDVWAAEIETSEGIVRDTMSGEMLWRLAITCE